MLGYTSVVAVPRWAFPSPTRRTTSFRDGLRDKPFAIWWRRGGGGMGLPPPGAPRGSDKRIKDSAEVRVPPAARRRRASFHEMSVPVDEVDLDAEDDRTDEYSIYLVDSPPSSCWASPGRPVLAVFAVRLAVASARTPGIRRTRSSGSCRFSHCRERADSPPKPDRHQRHRGHCRLANRTRAEPQLKPQRHQHCWRLGQLAGVPPKTKTLGVACPACGRGQKTKGDSPSSLLMGEDSQPGTPRFSY